MDKTFLTTIGAICAYHIRTNECSDTCPIWKVVQGDCFPCNIWHHAEALEPIIDEWCENHRVHPTI